MKYAKKVINYVLESLDCLDIAEMKMTLEILLKLIEKMPEYYAEEVFSAVLGEEGGSEDAE